jgi:hypothetical protein
MALQSMRFYLLDNKNWKKLLVVNLSFKLNLYGKSEHSYLLSFLRHSH